MALVADCDEDSRTLVTELISEIGFTAVTVDSGSEALAVAHTQLPSLVVLDVDLANPSAYAVCHSLRDEFGESFPIVFVSATRTSTHDEVAGLLLGADAYFNKPLETDLFMAKVRRLIARGRMPGIATSLTCREREVLTLLVEGRRVPEIAATLFITPKTAATHIEHILVKLGAHSQAQAVAFAIRDHILGLPLHGSGDY